MGGKCDNKEGDFILAHPFPRILGHKRGGDIMECDIMEARVYEIVIQSPN